MKFKYNGRDGMKDFNLSIAGILPMEETLKKGQEIEINDNHELVPRLRENGLWEEIIPKPKESTKKAKIKPKTNKGGD